MTFFHFGNCVALAYVPYVIVYKCSGLAEYSAFWKCVQAGVAYMLTQLCKMMILATFFPPSDLPEETFDIVGEFLKCTVDFADLVGLHFVMSKVAGKGQLKFMIAGMGWATAELVMTRFLPLWVGARGIEFDWKYIQMSFDSNVSLSNVAVEAVLDWCGTEATVVMQHIATATLVWLYNRHDLHKSLVSVVAILLVLSSYRPVIVEVLIHAVGLGTWTVLLAKLLFTSSVGLIALRLYVSLSLEVNSYY